MRFAKLILLATFAASVCLAAAQTIYYKGRSIDLTGSDRSYRANGELMVSGIALALRTDVRYDHNQAGEIHLYFKLNHIVYKPGRRTYLMGRRTFDLREPSDNRGGKTFLPFEMFQVVSDRAISLERGSGWPDDGGGGNRPDISLQYRGRELQFSRNEEPYRKDGSVMVPFNRTAAQLPGIRDERDRGRKLVYLFGDRRELSHQEGSRTFQIDDRSRDLRTRSEDRNGLFYVPVELFKAIAGNDLRVSGEGSGGGGGWPDDGNRPPDRPSLAIEYRGRTLNFGSDEQPYRQGSVTMVAFNKTANQINGLTQERDRGRRLVYLRGFRRELSHSEGSSEYRMDGRNRDMRGRSEDRNGTFYVPLELFQAITGEDLRVSR